MSFYTIKYYRTDSDYRCDVPCKTETEYTSSSQARKQASDTAATYHFYGYRIFLDGKEI